MHNTLHTYCTTLLEATRAASAWAADNPDVVRNELDVLQAELRRSGRIFRQCARAAERKMCVGVFGPSQAGKSYLISALARDATGGLMAAFGQEQHDFISEINPEGGKESTGLVTRFTMTRPKFLPEAFPVQVRLLSETDVVKTLANTYYADCEHKEVPDTDAINALLEGLAGRGQQDVTSHIDLDALEDLREYLSKDFQAKPRVQELERVFWKRALTLGPTLALEERITLYSCIWDTVPQLTALLRILLSALAKLDFAAEAFCPMSALIPREGSIIDVAMLQGLEDTSGATLPIRTATGMPQNLQRAVVTALTAELTIVMEQKPDDYFEHTDLLDFPGYRSRYKLTDVLRELEKPTMSKELFLRGKVAYLFQRYCAEKELTSMLLCIGPSNQEVQDLPAVINDWLVSTHGERPEARRQKPVALYFILTKFDMEFEQKKGAPSVESRWDNRLHASLLDFFGKQHDWPRLWDGLKAFSNLFLLRNPNFRFDAILEYDADGREKGIRPDQQTYVTDLEQAFMKSPLVKAHFDDPRTSWDAAMRLNDGGIDHIRQCLRPLCNPNIKKNQIATQLHERQEKLLLRLKPFYRTDDKEEERQQKEALARQLMACFARMLQNQRMGDFLHTLCVKDHELFDLYFEARRRYLATEDDTPRQQPNVSIGQTAKADDIFAELMGESATAAPQATESVPHTHKDEAQYFSTLIEAHWCQHLHKISDDTSCEAYYAFPADLLSRFVSELTLGAARLKLSTQMEDAMRKAAAYTSTSRERMVWQQVGMATALMNAYICWLGCNPRTCTAKERTVAMGGTSHVLFTPPAPIVGYPHLPELPEPFEKQWCMDWLRALYALLMDNVNFEGGITFDRVQNTRLGESIRALQPTHGEAQ